MGPIFRNLESERHSHVVIFVAYCPYISASVRWVITDNSFLTRTMDLTNYCIAIPLRMPLPPINEAGSRNDKLIDSLFASSSPPTFPFTNK